MAATISISSIAAITLLSIAGGEIPETLTIMALSGTAYLFGVVTNGSGLGGPK